MSKKLSAGVACAALLLGVVALGAVSSSTSPATADDPFGGAADVKFAGEVWKQMDGYRDWKLASPVYVGGSPHGKWVRLFSTWVTVDGRAHPIIIKENFSGRGVTQEGAQQNPDQWLKAVTIMLQREEGYDADNQNWYWVKYKPDGEIEKNENGVALAGRVAKGATKGCISCHSQAGGEDFLFSNDE